MKLRFLIGPLIMLTTWQIIASIGIFSPVFISSPSKVLTTLLMLLIPGSSSVLPDLGQTIYRTFLGILIAATVGIPVGLLMGISRRVTDSLEFVIDFGRSVPATALIPILVFFLGIGDGAKIALVSLACSLIIILNAMYGVKHASPTRRMAARTMGIKGPRLFITVILWDAFPQILVGVRTALSLALVLVVVSEMFLGGGGGLGRRIYDAQLMYRIEEMYSCIIIVGVIGYTLNRLFVLAERWLVHWTGK